MEALWHSAINVGIVIFSIVLAIACLMGKKPVSNSLIAFLGGVFIYGLHFYFGYSEGACEFTVSDKVLQHFVNAESCIDSYSYDISMAQIAIIGAILVWLALVWKPVFRKLEQDEAQESERNET